MFMMEINADSYYALLGVAPDAVVAEIRDARDRMVAELRERERREPTNREALVDLQRAINAAGEELVRPGRRERYDARYPHLRFFAVRTAAAPLFTDRADRLEALRAAVAAHLDAAGVPVRPSGTDRTDFTGDFTHHRLLDDDA
jgi:hypothetical protein